MCRMKLINPNIAKEERAKILKAIERHWGRASHGAQADLGEEWDDILKRMGKDKEIKEGVRQEDFYTLASTGGLSDEWMVEAARVILLKPEKTAVAEGWPRTKPLLGQAAAQVGFMKRLYESGVGFLEDLEVYRNMSAQREKGEPFLKNPSYQDDVTRRIFSVPGGMTFFEFI
jgi:hypothetical protein